MSFPSLNITNLSVFPSNPSLSAANYATTTPNKDVQGTFIKPYAHNNNNNNGTPSSPSTSTSTTTACNFVGHSPSPTTNFVVPQVQAHPTQSPILSPHLTASPLPSSVPSSPMQPPQPRQSQHQLVVQLPSYTKPPSPSPSPHSHSPHFPSIQQQFSASLPLLATCSMCGNETNPSSLKHGPVGRSGVCEMCWEKWNLRQLTLAQAKSKHEYKKIMSGAVNNNNNNNVNNNNNSNNPNINNNNNNNNSNYSQMEEEIDGGRNSGNKKTRSSHRLQQHPRTHYHIPSINSPMSESDDEYVDNSHSTPSSSIFPDSPDTHSSYESHPSSPPIGIDSRELGNGKDYYFCKYCETTWPLTFFRNRQQFGAHCSNCSRRRRPRDPSVMSAGIKRIRTDDTEIEDHRLEERHVRHQKPTPVHVEEKPQDINSAFNTPVLFGLPKGGDNNLPFGGDMLERLLNVVEGKLVEENELEGIKSELARMRKELVKREESNATKVDEVVTQLLGYVRNLRVHIASELAEFEESGIRVVDQVTGSVLDELKGLSYLKGTIEKRFDDMKDRMCNNTRKVETTVVTEISKCEEQLQDRLSKLNKDMSKQTDDLKKKLTQMERALRDDARVSKTAKPPSKDASIKAVHSKSRDSPLIPKRNFSESIYYPSSPQQ